MNKKIYAAEALGTFWLVFGGCGSALFAANQIGFLGVSLAFGLSVMSAAVAVGHLSGGHFNPAVTLATAIDGRIGWARVPHYVVSQLAGAIAAAFVLYLAASGRADFSLEGGFAANGFGAHSPGQYGLGAALLMELVGTAFFVFVILAITAEGAALAPLTIGATLALIHLVLIPVTNASVNPARSTSQALFSGDWALGQLWAFWLAPLAGAAVGAYVFRAVKCLAKND